VIEKNYCEFEAEGQEFANILRSLEHFLGKGESQNIFEIECLSNLMLKVSKFLQIEYIGTNKVTIGKKMIGM
jgi:hypothetical protein